MNTKLYPHQQDLENNILADYKNGLSKVVLAAACGGGKTTMAISICEKLIGLDPELRILVLAHGQTILRKNFWDAIKEETPNFSSAVIDSKSSKNSINDPSVNVIVALPQTIQYEKTLNFDVLVVDEAHEFYFAKMVKNIERRIKPKFTLLLTGSPSKFVKDKKKYSIHSMALLDLLDKGTITDPIIELAKTRYDYTLKDYNQNDELLTSVRFSYQNTSDTLDDLLADINLVINAKTRTLPTVRNVTKTILGDWASAIGKLDKTMFVCRSQSQANQVSKYFTKKLSKKVVAKSISESDVDSTEINRFTSDIDCKILIVVGRGILGFNYPELVNVIDLSGSLNVDRIFQLFSRLVRKHPNGKKKLFFKVVPEALEIHAFLVMSFVMALTHKDNYETYEGDYRNHKIPLRKNVVNQLLQQARKAVKAFSKNKKKNVSLPDLPQMNTMHRMYHKGGKLLESFAQTSLADVRKLLAMDKTLADFPELCKEYDPAKNGGLLPEHISYGSDRKVIWTGKCGHYWESTISSRTISNANCLDCSGKKQYTTQSFILKARQVHAQKYTYDNVNYKNSGTKISITCPEHGDFHQLSSSHLSGVGCPDCAINKKMTTESFIAKANNIHKSRYKYHNVQFVNSLTPVVITCPEHGDFHQTPSSHLSGHNCSDCGGQFRYTTNSYIDKANKIHKGKYQYDKVEYVNNKTKIIVNCPIHGDFHSNPKNHLQGVGCMKCCIDLRSMPRISDAAILKHYDGIITNRKLAKLVNLGEHQIGKRLAILRQEGKIK